MFVAPMLSVSTPAARMCAMSEADFLEAFGNAAAKDAPSDTVARILKEGAVAVERWRLTRALNDYQRIQRVKSGRDTHADQGANWG
jgi:hypothetical protein